MLLGSGAGRRGRIVRLVVYHSFHSRITDCGLLTHGLLVLGGACVRSTLVDTLNCGKKLRVDGFY